MTDATPEQIEPAVTPESQPEQTGETTDGVSMSQKAFTERLRRAQASAIADFLKGVGFEKPDEFNSFIEDAKKRQQAEMSDTERVKAELEAERQKTARAIEAAERAEARRIEAIRNAAILTAAQAANAKVPEDVLLFAQTQDTSALIGDDGEPDKKAIAQLIDTVKKDRAHWFGNGGSGTPGSPSNANGSLSELDKKAKQAASGKMTQFVRNRF